MKGFVMGVMYACRGIVVLVVLKLGQLQYTLCI